MNLTLEAETAEIAETPDVVLSGERSASSRCERFVAFYLGGDLYGLPAASVAEVSQPLQITPLPNAPEFLMGVAPLRGEIVAALGLKKLLRVESQSPDPKMKLIVLRSDEGETPIAFLVDKMHEIVLLAEDEVRPPARENDAYVYGNAKSDSGPIKILKPKSLAACLSPA